MREPLSASGGEGERGEVERQEGGGSQETRGCSLTQRRRRRAAPSTCVKAQITEPNIPTEQAAATPQLRVVDSRPVKPNKPEMHTRSECPTHRRGSPLEEDPITIRAMSSNWCANETKTGEIGSLHLRCVKPRHHCHSCYKRLHLHGLPSHHQGKEERCIPAPPEKK